MVHPTGCAQYAELIRNESIAPWTSKGEQESSAQHGNTWDSGKSEENTEYSSIGGMREEMLAPILASAQSRGLLVR